MASGTFKRKRKLMVVAPVFITPLLCLLFWLADGGKGKAEKVEQNGINTAIPNSTNNQILGKDAAYRKILEDSLQKLKDEQENYVYANQLYKPALNSSTEDTRSSDHVLDDVNKSLSSMTEEMKNASGQNTSASKTPAEEYASQMKMTQELLKADPNYQALMGELGLGNTKPDSLNAKLVAKQEEHFIPVQSEAETKSIVHSLNPYNTDSFGQERFYNGMYYNKNRNGINTISAVVHDDQTVKEGTVVKLRLTNDINLSGLIIPRNTFVYGVAHLQDERLNVLINSIAFGNSIYPVKLMVYDIDGLVGIKIPGSVNQAAAKQSTGEIINAGTGNAGVGSVTVNQSASTTQQIASQLTASAIESGKQLLVKKISEIRVFLKAGYHIYLKQAT